MKNLECLYYLGMCYEYGIGCDIDYDKAVSCYKTAAYHNHPGALNNLGGCCLYGKGTDYNPDAAFRLFSKAQELGNSDACCRLGICYKYGFGCEADEKKAIIARLNREKEQFEQLGKENNANM